MRELLLFTEDEFVGFIEDDAVRKRIAHDGLRWDYPPIGAYEGPARGASKSDGRRAALRHTAVSYASAENAEIRIGILEDGTAVLVSPASSEDPPADEGPVLVLISEIASGLIERRQRLRKIGISLRIHFMIRVQGTVDRFRALRPCAEKSGPHLVYPRRHFQ